MKLYSCPNSPVRLMLKASKLSKKILKSLMSSNHKHPSAVKVIEEVEDLVLAAAERIRSVSRVNRRVKVDIVYRNSSVTS